MSSENKVEICSASDAPDIVEESMLPFSVQRNLRLID